MVQEFLIYFIIQNTLVPLCFYTHRNDFMSFNPICAAHHTFTHTIEHTGENINLNHTSLRKMLRKYDDPLFWKLKPQSVKNGKIFQLCCYPVGLFISRIIILHIISHPDTGAFISNRFIYLQMSFF